MDSQTSTPSLKSPSYRSRSPYLCTSGAVFQYNSEFACLHGLEVPVCIARDFKFYAILGLPVEVQMQSVNCTVLRLCKFQVRAEHIHHTCMVLYTLCIECTKCTVCAIILYTVHTSSLSLHFFHTAVHHLPVDQFCHRCHFNCILLSYI